MDLLNTLLNSGNGELINQIANQINADGDSAKGMTGLISAELIKQIREKIAGEEDSSELEKVIEENRYEELVDNPDKIQDETIKNEGFGLLDLIGGSNNSTDDIVENVAKKTGFDTSLIQNLIPILLPVVIGAISKGKNDISSNSNSTNQNPIIAMLDMDNDGSVVDDLFNMARKFF